VVLDQLALNGFNHAFTFYQRFESLCGDDKQQSLGWNGDGIEASSNRLKERLSKCVLEDQFVLVEGRSILDNALIAIELEGGEVNCHLEIAIVDSMQDLFTNVKETIRASESGYAAKVSDL
ncbi:hypothetical protein A2U01_0001271, partial [Trifolium medium]|nr:hypothetical protein [Trifolium medium]